MITDIEHKLQDICNTEFQYALARLLGESEAGVSAALPFTISKVLEGLRTVTSSSDGAQALFDLIHQDEHDGKILQEVGVFFTQGSRLALVQRKGLQLAEVIFGPQLKSTIDSISSYSRLKASSASSLVGVFIPIVLGAVGDAVNTQKIQVNQLQRFLSEQIHTNQRLAIRAASSDSTTGNTNRYQKSFIPRMTTTLEHQTTEGKMEGNSPDTTSRIVAKFLPWAATVAVVWGVWSIYRHETTERAATDTQQMIEQVDGQSAEVSRRLAASQDSARAALKTGLKHLETGVDQLTESAQNIEQSAME